MRCYLKFVLGYICDATRIFGVQKWREAGFEMLEKLAHSVDTGLSANSEAETYHQLAWLRSWLFWVDLRKMSKCDEQVLLTALFYALVLSVVPLFPAMYIDTLL